MRRGLPWRVTRAAARVRKGGIVAYPTEAVYGLGCDPWNREAVLALLALKQRPMHKGLILIAADVRQLHPFLAPVSAEGWARISPTWPGPYTWVFPAHPRVPAWIRGRHSSIAVRVTAHPLVAELCRALAHPLVSTSANRAGRPPCRTLLQLQRELVHGLRHPPVHILAGAVGQEQRPTTILDALTGKVLRP